MGFDTLLLDWLRLGLRWLHVMAAIVWLGTAFYFMGLDQELRRRPARRPEDGKGEAWQVHGGGFYHIEGVVPGGEPPPGAGFARFRWPAYTTWISGFLLLAVLYYVEATLRLTGPDATGLSPVPAVLLTLASLTLGYTLYEGLCRAAPTRRPRVLALACFLLLTAFAWLHALLLDGRAALLLDGALVGTIMVANVAHIMIPIQRRALAAWGEGREPDAADLERARTRAAHNDHLALAAVLAMLGGHYPLLHEGGRSWLAFAAALVVSAGAARLWRRQHGGRGPGLTP
ncbi:urate hydroxylase PuuD [Benzoatithermus flavus]|uniref:Urate hydroxylase PuuD n=1 Tax=Benzoatithermus flavus TaxID=3108223 RepID=A0ABU8XM37_9PROT